MGRWQNLLLTHPSRQPRLRRESGSTLAVDSFNLRLLELRLVTGLSLIDFRFLFNLRPWSLRPDRYCTVQEHGVELTLKRK